MSLLREVGHEISATIHAQAHRTREHLHAAHEVAHQAKEAIKDSEEDVNTVPAYAFDLQVRFIGASGLPQMDVGGLCDPYFVANLDGKIHYTSSVQTHTLTPVWNENWHVKNVPSTAKLVVKVYDKDDGTVRDDYIGSFTVNLEDGAREFRIESSSSAQMGTMWLEMKLTSTRVPDTPLYTFDGPVNFSRHFSSAIGLFTGSGQGDVDKSQVMSTLAKQHQENDESLPMPPPMDRSKITPEERMRLHAYSTWKVHLKGVPIFFGDETQHWLTDYPKARSIFTGPAIVRASIRSAHRILYARTTLNEFGLINNADDFWKELAPQERRQAIEFEPPSGHSSNPTQHTASKVPWLVKPAMYTYIIGNDDMLRFSETGARFFADFASKHALHACCAETVRYSGEFHPRPLVDGGWAGLGGRLPPEDVEWELWIDNASGTYGPDAKMLPALQKTLEYNFSGIKVRTFHYEDEELAKSKKDILDYAQNKPNLTRTPSQAREEAPTKETVHAGEAATDKPDDEQPETPPVPPPKDDGEQQHPNE